MPRVMEAVNVDRSVPMPSIDNNNNIAVATPSTAPAKMTPVATTTTTATTSSAPAALGNCPFCSRELNAPNQCASCGAGTDARMVPSKAEMKKKMKEEAKRKKQEEKMKKKEGKK